MSSLLRAESAFAAYNCKVYAPLACWLTIILCIDDIAVL